MRRIGCIILLVMACMVSACGTENNTGFSAVSCEDVINKVGDKSTFLLMITHDDSYACDVFKEELQTVVKSNSLQIYTLNGTDMDASMKDQLNIALGDFNSWPVLFYVKNGTVTMGDMYEYSPDPEGWKSWMETMKLIANGH